MVASLFPDVLPYLTLIKHVVALKSAGLSSWRVAREELYGTKSTESDRVAPLTFFFLPSLHFPLFSCCRLLLSAHFCFPENQARLRSCEKESNWRQGEEEEKVNVHDFCVFACDSPVIFLKIRAQNSLFLVVFFCFRISNDPLCLSFIFQNNNFNSLMRTAAVLQELDDDDDFLYDRRPLPPPFLCCFGLSPLSFMLAVQILLGSRLLFSLSPSSVFVWLTVVLSVSLQDI